MAGFDLIVDYIGGLSTREGYWFSRITYSLFDNGNKLVENKIFGPNPIEGDPNYENQDYSYYG